MAETFPFSPPLPPPSVDPKTGFCAGTTTFHSLRPDVPLPPESLPLSFPSFAFSLLPSPLPSSPALVDSTTGLSLSYPAFVSHVRSLSHHLRSQFHLSNGDVAFVLSPSRLDVPVLYFALLSIGAVVSRSNPLSSPSELSRQLRLVNPSIVFATSATAPKLPASNRTPTVLLDSAEFQSLVTDKHALFSSADDHAPVGQGGPAAIQFLSGPPAA